MDTLEKVRTCFFTGHRVLPRGKQEIMEELLCENIEKLIIDYDVKNFICGGALGFDTMAAKSVIKMRKKYPHIRLLMYIPCYGQSRKWSDEQKYEYKIILSAADDIIYITECEYSEGCMMLRNKRMISDSFFCIAFCIKTRSGTGSTLRIARDAAMKIIDLTEEIY